MPHGHGAPATPRADRAATGRNRRRLRVLLVGSAWAVPGALRLRDASRSSLDGVDLIEAVRASWAASSAPRFRDRDFDEGLMLRRLHAEENLTDHPFPHFYVHIPKAAGYYAMQTLMDLLFHASPQMTALPRNDQFRICNLGSGALMNRPKEYQGIKCTMYMSEKQYNPVARHAYAVVRDPREHVLSQYFHCAESPDHARRYSGIMPSLDEWLEAWEYYQQVGLENVTSPRTFGCYSPISMQSRYTHFDPRNVSGIQRRFTVIGPMDELDRTLCAIFVHYARWVPEACICDAGADVGHERRLGPEAGSHGVVHHGHSYNTTGYQDALIRRLVEKDSMLYEYVYALFRRQVRVIEREHNVTLCGRIGKIEKNKKDKS